MTINAEEKAEIQELASNFYLFLDAENAPGLASLFASDGKFVAPYGTFEGPAKIEAFFASHIAAGNEDGVKHFITNFVIEETAGGARLRFYILKMGVRVGPSLIATASGDCLVKSQGGRWLFEKLEFRVDLAAFANTK